MKFDVDVDVEGVNELYSFVTEGVSLEQTQSYYYRSMVSGAIAFQIGDYAYIIPARLINSIEISEVVP